MNIYNKWNKDFYEKQDQYLEDNKKKDVAKTNTDVDALTQNFQDLKNLTPLEIDLSIYV